MPKFLTAALVAMLALPAFAQTPSRTPTPAARTAPPTATTTAPTATTAPPTPTPAPRTAPTTTGGKVDINSATEAQLDSLFGIGPVRAKAIVAARPYEELQDLVKKKVLTQGVLDGAMSRMALANINTSSAKQMEKTLPGIGEVRSKEIVAGRPYATPQDLVTKRILTQNVYDKMKDLVAY